MSDRPGTLFSEGLGLMRERIVLYVAFASASRSSRFFSCRRRLRRLEPTFRMTAIRAAIAVVAMALLLILTFIYFECVRYALIVRWYRRLAAEDRSPASP